MLGGTAFSVSSWEELHNKYYKIDFQGDVAIVAGEPFVLREGYPSGLNVTDAQPLRCDCSEPLSCGPPFSGMIETVAAGSAMDSERYKA